MSTLVTGARQVSRGPGVGSARAITGSGDALNGSHLLVAGVPLTDVSKCLGHVNPHVTATVHAQRVARRG
jgi:hypothetical protein